MYCYEWKEKIGRRGHWNGLIGLIIDMDNERQGILLFSFYDCEGVKNEGDACSGKGIGLWGLFIQGIATSIDALSVGFVISDYDFTSALLASLLIGLVTFVICMIGLFIGRKAGMKFAGKAGILGGVILILIGLEIFVSSWL